MSLAELWMRCIHVQVLAALAVQGVTMQGVGIYFPFILPLSGQRNIRCQRRYWAQARCLARLARKDHTLAVEARIAEVCANI